jgi:hypothetical protein
MGGIFSRSAEVAPVAFEGVGIRAVAPVFGVALVGGLGSANLRAAFVGPFDFFFINSSVPRTNKI